MELFDSVCGAFVKGLESRSMEICQRAPRKKLLYSNPRFPRLIDRPFLLLSPLTWPRKGLCSPLTLQWCPACRESGVSSVPSPPALKTGSFGPGGWAGAAATGRPWDLDKGGWGRKVTALYCLMDFKEDTSFRIKLKF